MNSTRPQIIVATQQVELESNGNWIDPYAAKRRKNARANQRREVRRQQRLEKESVSSEEDEQVIQVSEEPETMWKE
jgi:hypothetical protein